MAITTPNKTERKSSWKNPPSGSTFESIFIPKTKDVLIPRHAKNHKKS